MDIRTFSSLASEWTLDAHAGWQLAFCGMPIDSRGQAACAMAGRHAQRVLTCRYDTDNLRALIVDQVRVPGRDLSQYFQSQSRVLFEATTLDLVELLELLRAARLAGVGTIDVLYAEPERYRPVETPWLREFSLSEARRFEGVPGFVTDLAQPDIKGNHLVVFLGYEGGRLAQAVEQVEQISGWAKTAVFGIPGYAPGWEINALANNAATLNPMSALCVEYCGASSVSGAYALLTRVHERPGTHCTVVAPLGTKPHTIASALFLVEKCQYQQATLIWDHPQRSAGRSEEVRRWHLYRVTYST
ncbi:MAG: hypothetical protein E6Q50_14360 [Lysobacter sp.]|nr:MAG: hypothetical protein E6Q50_14360 [Lysobacter sp.]